MNIFLCFCFFLFLVGNGDGQSTSCRDALDPYQCYQWYVSGMCNDPGYRYLMIESCQKTCNLCPSLSRPRKKTSDCSDERKSCPKWKSHCGEYSRYYDFMTRHCQRTCLFCQDENCADKKKRCEQFRLLGYCQRDHKFFQYMKKNCELSCQFCQPVEEPTTKLREKNYVKEFECDFEKDECDWTNQQFEDTSNWIVGIDDYGPQVGFNNSKKYLYLDSKYSEYYAYLWLPWELILPDDTKNIGEMCFHFMYQLNDGKIHVYQRSNPTASTKFPEKVLKFAVEEKKKSWTHGQVNVYVSDRYHLLLKGTKGDSESHLVIDDMFFTRGTCY